MAPDILRASRRQGSWEERYAMQDNVDVIIIGAGISGLYAQYRMRELGLSVQGFEAGSDVGGTWYWNRYPGARFDSESYSYQFSFSEELIQEWTWSEKFAGQPEIERYVNFVADKFDLKRAIEFNSRVESVVFDDASRTWTVETLNGKTCRGRFVLCATGLLSAYQMPPYPGTENFKGLSLHSARWPKEDIDFSGKKVAIIGSGPTAVQILQTIAPQVGELKLFQRTANWCTPLRNQPVTAAEQEEMKVKANDVFELCKRTAAAFIHDMDMRASTEVSKAERMAKYQELYERGGFALWLGNYNDVFHNRALADEISEFLAEKIRQRVKDPVKADKLIPKNHPYGTKRPPGEKNYYEAFNQDNVDVVDLRATPIVKITASGVETTDATYDFDVIIYCTGFQSLTGELMRIDIRGEQGVALKDHWAKGPKTNLGVQFAGFPNLFAIMGPHNPGTFCNITRCVESNTDWITGCIRYVLEHGYKTIQATPEAEAAWTEKCHQSVKGMLIDEMRDSWFFGNNNRDGGVGQYLMYAGSVPSYRALFNEVAAKGYEGFEFRA
jgi:cation diffusion facilitator CzcD-associated flavoprotein CzcO